jgi:hypothetical protein
MPSYTLSFNINLAQMERLSALQKRRRRSAISPDLFCKQLIQEALDAADVEAARKKDEKP